MLWGAVVASLLAGAVAWALASAVLHTHKKTALAIMFAVPLASFGIYIYLGNAFAPDTPLAPRIAGELETLPTGAIIVRLETRLRDNPDDARGWGLLARLRHRLGQYDKAGQAWRRVLSLAPTPTAYVGLAETIIESEEGIVSPEATRLINAALTQEPDHIAARFWQGLAAQQQGDTARARAVWQRLAADLPPDAPLSRVLAEYLAQP